MSQPTDASKPEPPKNLMARILDVVEKVGNKVPHPAVIFLVLILLVVVFSAVLSLAGVAVTSEEIVASPSYPNPDKIVEADPDNPGKYRIIEANPDDPSKPHAIYTEATKPDRYKVVKAGDAQYALIETRVIPARSLLTIDGLRFMYSSLIPSFMAFTALGLLIAAMVGVGVAEESGLIKVLIRKLVIVAPGWALTYILAFVGIVASIAADAGYLVLIPLAAVAFLKLGRHPIAGLALGFASVAAAFTVNILIKPLDAVLVEFTNDAISLAPGGGTPIGLASNLWFSIASVILLTFVVGFITERLIEPRLGKYEGEKPDDEGATLSADESRGLKYAGLAFLGVLVMFGLLALPPGAPLRNPETDDLIGNSPFMNGLIALIMVAFLATGAAFGYGAKTMKNLTDVIKAIEKSLSGMGGLIFLFFIISQFIAYFNYTNMGTLLAMSLAGVLKEAGFPALLLLLGFIVVVALIDLLITGAIAKWALFAPVFVPLLVTLGVYPEAVLAAYRVADSPLNAITPLNAYFALVVTFCQKYDKKAGVGTVVSLMLPYVVIMFVLWTILFAAWQLLGLPWGL